MARNNCAQTAAGSQYGVDFFAAWATLGALQPIGNGFAHAKLADRGIRRYHPFSLISTQGP
jgi:hypothetical protein